MEKSPNQEEMIEKVLRERQEDLARLLESQKRSLETGQDRKPRPLSKSEKFLPVTAGCRSH